MNKTLVEKAKEVKSKTGKSKIYTQEEIDLALSWLSGDIKLSQLSSVLFDNGKRTTQSYGFIALALKSGLEQNCYTVYVKKWIDDDEVDQFPDPAKKVIHKCKESK